MSDKARAYFEKPQAEAADSPYLDRKGDLLFKYYGNPWLSVGCGETWMEDPSEACDLVRAPLLRRRQAGDSCVQGDAMQLPYKSERFVLVSALSMLYYVPDQRQAVLEVERVLRPGGIAILEFLGWSLRALHSMWKYPLPHYPLLKAQIRSILAGWEILEWHECLRDVLPAKHLVVARKRRE